MLSPAPYPPPLPPGGPEEDELLLVKQFRPAVNAYTLEFPAGLIDKGLGLGLGLGLGEV